jgi:pimeloyl-ACP methyl ester carboxylesterase
MTRFRYVSRRLGCLAATTLLAVLACSASAGATIAYKACKDDNDFGCAHLSVPLDPSNAAAGTLSLSLERHRAPLGEGNASSAIVALAGGPGQSALPFAQDFEEVLGPVAATRDLIVFDQRGTGKSHPLSCHAFDRFDPSSSLAKTIAKCAGQIGPTRIYYTTADTVADIEAVRQAGGYEKLVLYGTSYGTKVAEEYAEAYPQHVEALVLDSVVTPHGPEALNGTTFAAIPRILRQLCTGSLCAHVTRHPVADLHSLLARMAHGPVRARVHLPEGGRTHVSISSEDIFSMLLAGDFSGLLRAELLTDVSSAARGDEAPLARLWWNLRGSESSASESEEFDLPLYYATICEEEEMPFSRAATPPQRLLEARAAARALGNSAFLPFNARDAVAFGDIPGCSDWPYAGAPAQAAQAPLPDVPTLVLSGADDLRTPTANAQQIAAAIPAAKVLVVPNTGHSVLTSEPGSCASNALHAFFAARAIVRCHTSPPPRLLRPPDRPPLRLAAITPSKGYHGRAGRTLQAVKLTLHDFGVQLALRIVSLGAFELASAPKLAVGGLRAGWAEVRNSTVLFHHYSFIPGVTLSGSVKLKGGDLDIGGRSAAHGQLRSGAHESLVGRLAGQNVRLSSASIASAAIVDEDEAASATLDPRHPDRRHLPRGVARLLGWLLQL